MVDALGVDHDAVGSSARVVIIVKLPESVLGNAEFVSQTHIPLLRELPGVLKS
jgi:hypothetical protein